MTQSNTPAGWYDDGHGSERFWDGNAWTEQTRPLGGGSAPEPPAAPDSAATMFAPGGATASAGTPSSSPAAEPATPSSNADVTQVAPSGGFGSGQVPGQAPGQVPGAPAWQQPATTSQPAQPAWQQPGQPGQPGQPATPAWQQPGQPGWQQPQFNGSGGGGVNSKLIIAIAGGAAALLVFVVLLVVLLGGGGDPKSVAEDYLEANAKGDFERICELSTEEEQEENFEELDVDNCGDLPDAIKDQQSDEFNDYQDYIDDLEVDIEIGEVDEKEETAEVDYSRRNEYKGDDEDLAEQLSGTTCFEVEGTLELVKEDGDWKVENDNVDYETYEEC